MKLFDLRAAMSAAACVLMSLLLAGCAENGLRAGPPAPADLALAPAGPVSPGPAASQPHADYPVDLARLISRSIHDGRAIKLEDTFPLRQVYCRGADGKVEKSNENGACRNGNPVIFDPVSSLDDARKFFYDTCPNEVRCGTLRDRVQDRLLWASENACNDYLVDVRKSYTHTNLNLGAATTAFGALGTLLTSRDATRVFSGAAGLTSGIRAEYNDVYFASQAVELVSKAIHSLRERMLKRIQDGRRNADIHVYTLDGAIADAMRYHAACNVMAGLEEATESVSRERDPGMKRMNEVFQGLGAVVNVSLGAASIDLSTLPSASDICRQLGDEIGLGTAAINDRRLKLDANSTDANIEKATKLVNDLNKTSYNDAKSAQGIYCKETTESAKPAETAMYESARLFAAAPLSEKATARANVDVAKAKVMAIKVALEKALESAHRETVDIKAQFLANPFPSPSPTPP